MTQTATRHHLPALPPKIRPLTTEQSRRLNETFPGLPSIRHCITCRGTKAFSWYGSPISRDPADVVGYECPCTDQYILHRRFLHSGIHENFQRLGLADFEHIPDEAADVMTEYLTNADAFVAAGFGLVIHGDKGNGKTLLANLILKDLVSQGFDCYANTFASMIDAFADGWRDKEDRKWFSSRVRNADVLLIDDLFRERNKGVGTVGENALEETLRHRIARSKPTIITMNPDPEEIEKAYGGHTVSLLAERSRSYRFSGPDRRAEMNDRFRAEVLAGLTRPIVVA